jgi:glycosyltransferase involved in cell wall biosynthesis
MTARRIAYVLKIFPKLSETFIANELAELRRRGVELRILSLLPPRDELRHDIVADAGLDGLTTYDIQKFESVLRDFRPQLLHAHFATESTAAARELAGAHNIPFTFTAHGYDIHRKPPPDFTARAKAASAVVTVSQANAAHITNTFSVPASHIRVIPCGVDTEYFRPPARSVFTNLPLIVCVARHVVVKNLDLLLQACAALRSRGLNFRCILIGDGPCRDELEATRAQLGLNDFVQMPGAAKQSDVLKWWQQAAVGVLTSGQEGMPVCLMEAAACGVPVVATAVGGVPELVRDGITGLLVPARDSAGLAAALERLLGDPGLRSRMSREARRVAVEKFSLSAQVDQLLALWTSILNGATP